MNNKCAKNLLNDQDLNRVNGGENMDGMELLKPGKKNETENSGSLTNKGVKFPKSSWGQVI